MLCNLLQFCARSAALAIISLVLPMTAVKAAIPKSGTTRLHPGTAYDEVGHLAGLARVAAAFGWFHDRQQELLDRQAELARIPAPPFGESARSQWLAARFREIGLEDIHIDEIGNVLGVRRGTSSRQKFIAITAHVDTVFPAGTAVEIRREGQKLYGPGVSDNAAGVTAMLAIAGALNAANIRTEAPIVFIGNVRGMRHIFSSPRWRDAIAYTLVVDGAGTDTVVAEALGSRRFLVTIHGPGGHSWRDFGLPNPIMVLADALEIFRRTPIPSTPKTTFNVGVISGGTSVNSIPESASMRVDIRSIASEQVERLERALRDALEQAVNEESRNAGGKRAAGLTYEMKLIGSRPAARLSPDSRMLAVIHAVDEFLGNKARVQRASTDANIPISLGHEALAIGAGGSGGGAHTIHEWYDATGRELGLKRILLTVLTLAGVRE